MYTCFNIKDVKETYSVRYFPGIVAATSTQYNLKEYSNSTLIKQIIKKEQAKKKLKSILLIL